MAPDDLVYRSTIRGQMAELTVEDAASRTFRLTVDGVPQSQVCLADPTIVDFDYARHIARVIDAQAAEGVPLVCIHLGGGALTLPRYVQATRPGSVQYVVESEEQRTVHLLGILPLASGSDLRFVFGDARAVVDALAAGESSDGAGAGSDSAGSDAEGGGPPAASAPWTAADVTVVDLWAGSTIAARVASREFYARLAALSAPDGVLAVNLLHRPGSSYVRRQCATLLELFGHVVAALDSHMVDERAAASDASRAGNVVLFASNRPLEALLTPGWPTGDHNPPRMVFGEALRGWLGDALPLTDADATDSPSPDTGDPAGEPGD